MVSTSSRSIGDVGDVAEEQHAAAVGFDVDVLGDIGAVEDHGVGARLALDHVIVVAGIPDEDVVSGAEQRHIVAVAAVDVSFPALPMTVSRPRPPNISKLDPAGLEAAGVDQVVATEGVDHETVGRVGMIDGHPGRKGRRPRPACPPRRWAMESMPLVALTVTLSSAPSAVLPLMAAARSMATLVTSVPGEVADDGVVGAAQCVEPDGLDVVEVHHDVADVAEEQHPPAVGEDVEVLAVAAAIEQHGIGPGLTLDHVAAVARIPLEHVIAGPEKRHVLPWLPSMKSSPSPPSSRSSPLPPKILSLPTPPSTVSWIAAADKAAASMVSRPPRPLTTRESVDVGMIDRHLGGETGDGDGGPDRCHVDVVRSTAAVDDNCVELAVACCAADHPGEVDGDMLDVRAGQVVDGGVVFAAQRVEPDGLDVVQVHRDVAEVAEESHSPAVGRDVEILVAGAAV
jgi:hypothetical protein